MVAARERAKVMPKVFSWAGAQTQLRGQTSWPAQNRGHMRPVEDGPRELLKLPADGVDDEQVRLILTTATTLST
jgi:hypothetical protein